MIRIRHSIEPHTDGRPTFSLLAGEHAPGVFVLQIGGVYTPGHHPTHTAEFLLNEAQLVQLEVLLTNHLRSLFYNRSTLGVLAADHQGNTND